MKLIRLILLFLLVLSCSIATSVPTSQPNVPVQAQTTNSLSPTQLTPIQSLPAARLDLQQLEQALDRQDIADAVRQVEVGWKRQYEEYYQGQFTTQLLGINQIARSLEQTARLTDKKSALIYAFSLPEQIELILVLPEGQFLHKRITISRGQFNETAQTFRREVTNVISQPSDYLPASQQLYQWLISPLVSELQSDQIDTLVFCLGAGLRSLPIAALHDGQQFLIEQYSLALIPAFNLLDRHPAIFSGTEVLAMGASEFQQQIPLPAVPLELAAVRNLWEGESWLNQEFTLEKLKAQRSTYPFGIIHLATHAEFSPGSVEASYIQFWNQRLQLNHLKDMGLRMPVVQLLVLSACRTALGDPSAELGFAGLAVQSGAKAALASLWSVSDAGTLVLMVDFYQQLKTAPTKTEALQQAQLAMLHRQVRLSSPSIQQAIGTAMLPPELTAAANINLSHPYYWAAFTMIGNPW
jgi:CHAT domain-containing protein